MNTKKYFLWLMMILAVAVISCEKDEDEESCDSENVSADFSCPVDIDTFATFCSDGVNNSYYTFNGNDYQCTGVDASTCESALTQIGIALIEVGCSTKKSGSVDASLVKLSSMAERLLEEVRSESLCN